jgi:hypothetical protein
VNRIPLSLQLDLERIYAHVVGQRFQPRSPTQAHDIIQDDVIAGVEARTCPHVPEHMTAEEDRPVRWSKCECRADEVTYAPNPWNSLIGQPEGVREAGCAALIRRRRHAIPPAGQPDAARLRTLPTQKPAAMLD